MKPRFKLYANGTVGLADAPEAFQYFCNVRYLRTASDVERRHVLDNCQESYGSLAEYCRRFGIAAPLFTAAISARNVGVALGGAAGTLRVLLGLPTASSAYTKPLTTDLRVSVRALCVARRGPDAIRSEAPQ